MAVTKQYLEQLSSTQLIDLLAELGFGCKFGNKENDTRIAYIYEIGTFTQTGNSYAKIVVKVDDTEIYDYGVRVIINSPY